MSACPNGRCLALVSSARVPWRVYVINSWFSVSLLRYASCTTVIYKTKTRITRNPAHRQIWRGPINPHATRGAISYPHLPCLLPVWRRTAHRLMTCLWKTPGLTRSCPHVETRKLTARQTLPTKQRISTNTLTRTARRRIPPPANIPTAPTPRQFQMKTTWGQTTKRLSTSPTPMGMSPTRLKPQTRVPTTKQRRGSLSQSPARSNSTITGPPINVQLPGFVTPLTTRSTSPQLLLPMPQLYLMPPAPSRPHQPVTKHDNFIAAVIGPRPYTNPLYLILNPHNPHTPTRTYRTLVS